MRLVLASASPARRTTLERAGVEPHVVVSSVDEEAVLADAHARYGALAPHDQALLLARAKCEDVAADLESAADLDPALMLADELDVVVVGCDSLFEVDGVAYGKPSSAAEARSRWSVLSGGTGVLHTGHWIVDLRAAGTGATLGAVASTTVHFATLSTNEIEAYVDSGEPLNVAGAFTVDSLGGPFVTSVEGDYHNVVGLSLPLLRELLGEIDISWPTLWRRQS